MYLQLQLFPYVINSTYLYDNYDLCTLCDHRTQPSLLVKTTQGSKLQNKYISNTE